MASIPFKDQVSRRLCRHCQAPLEHIVADLGVSPLCETYLTEANLYEAEVFYPLCAYVCERCYLVQVQDFESPEAIFREYAYFSSYSDSWLQHAKRYADDMTKRFGLSSEHQVIEVASNDGYLLKNFVAKGIKVLGIDPAKNIAKVANDKGVRTLAEFFGESLAKTLASETKADLMVANNVLAHVPDINDFIKGFKQLLKPAAVVTFEFPHLLSLLREKQFDTIYHEHFSYLSFLVTERMFSKYGLRIFDVETLASHGGSLRIYACHQSAAHKPTERVDLLRQQEIAAGLSTLDPYLSFNREVQQLKHRLLSLLIACKDKAKHVVGYGAPGKGNTLLNYCGIREDLLSFTVDRNPYKQGKFLPGTHIPIYAPEKIAEVKPDYILILPWNLKKEIMTQLAFVREWGAKFIVPIPEPRILD